MLIMTFKHESSLITYLRCFYKTLSGPSIDESLYFNIMILNSSLEKGFHFYIGLEESSFRTLILIW